jgi:predicted N-acyltransferase
MPDGSEAVTVKVLSGVDEIAAAEWDACAGPDNPFVSHAFLNALEDTGCASGVTGWLPRHLAIEDAAGRLIGAAPMYLKTHSYGEYVFDWGWAEAYERAGGKYYPKLQASIPFTPVTGPRLLLRRPATEPGVANALIAAMVEVSSRLDVSSLHVTFPTQDQWQLLGERGFLKREGQQFHWLNPGYGSFDDFLATLASRKRKAIRKERRAAIDAGITIETLTGADILPRHWDAFHGFYMDTANRKWGHPYLSRDFFARLGETLGDKVVLIMAARDGREIAGALNLRGADALYGRNWGCLEDHRFLHFELCYYRAMDFAIGHGLARVEAGAGGRHKVQRGYLPVPTYSAHWIRDTSFRSAVERFLDEERREIGFERSYLTRHGPFRKDGPGPSPEDEM